MSKEEKLEGSTAVYSATLMSAEVQTSRCFRMKGAIALPLRPLSMLVYTTLPPEPTVIRAKAFSPFFSPTVCHVAVLVFLVLVPFIHKCDGPELATLALLLAVFA
ncbi:hypothetical protein KC367_g147 [Hortaea werneckii]|nr:hypothetical protein KC367_g147 [Hortaea werneckii]